MNAYIKGVLIEKTPAKIVIENSKAGYSLNVSLSSYDSLPSVGAEITIYTFISIKNEEISFFGFSSEKEKRLFLKLISIPKIGPKTAMSIFNSLSADDFENAVLNRNSALLAKAKGISKKTADAIILELSGKLSQEGSGVRNDAYEALIALGFSQKDVDAVIKDSMESVENKEDFESIIREALKRLR